MNTRTALVGSALGLALIGLTNSTSVQAQNPTQTIGPGVPFDMPRGVTSEPRPPRVAPRPRIPIGEEVLEQIKRRPPTDRSGSPATPQQRAPTPQAISPQAITENCGTNPSFGGGPPDTHGAVGLTTLVVVTNSDIGVLSKTDCTPLSLVSLAAFFGAAFAIPATQSLFDPRVIYDPTIARFLVTAESRDLPGNTDQFQYYAVSRDADGMAWFLYRIALSQGASFFCKPSAAHFWDFPQAGSSNGANPRWHITADVFNPGGGPFSNAALLSIDKTTSLFGGPMVVNCVSQALPGNSAATLVEDANNTVYLLSPGSGMGNAIRRFAFTPGANPPLDTIVETAPINIPAWLAARNAPQPNGVRVDTLDGRFSSATIQRGTNLWNVHAIANGATSAARAYRLSTTGTTALGIATLFTSATDFVFMPSIATNSVTAFVTASRTDPGAGAPAGNAAVVIFNGSNTLNFPFAFDVVGTSPTQFQVIPNPPPQPGGSCLDFQNPIGVPVCRWGDYSSTQIDPGNSGVAWGFNELVNGPDEFAPFPDGWTTRAGSVVSLQAPTSRLSNFLFPCNGQIQTTSFNFGALPPNTDLLIVATELVLFENQGGLQFVLLSVNGDRTRQLATMGLPATARQAGGGDHVFNQSPYGLASATTDGTGQVRIQVDGACNGGFGNLQGTATVWFSGPAAL
jgi:hypothetical protein